MGIEVAQNDSIAVVEKVEDWIYVEAITWSTRRLRRNIAVQDEERRVVYFDGDSEDFEERIGVGDVREIDDGEWKRMMHERDETTAAIASAIKVDNGVVAKVWIANVRQEFCFLKAADENVFAFKEVA